MNTGIINNPITEEDVKNHFTKDSFLEMQSYWENKKSSECDLVNLSSIGKEQSPTAKTWTPAIWELDGNTDIAKQQAEIIKEFIANPDYNFNKIQGGGRPNTLNVIKGKRELHFGEHYDVGNNHLHTLHYNYSISPNGTTNNKDDIVSKSEARAGFLKAINERLQNANLPTIKALMLNLRQDKDKASETTKAQVIEAVEEKKTYDEYKADVSHTYQINPVAVNDELNRLQAEFALVEEQQKKRLQSLQQLKEANEVALKYNSLVDETAKQKTKIEELNSNVSDLNEKLTTISNNFDSLQKGFNELADSNMSLQESLEEEQELRKNAEQEILLKDEELLIATKDIDDLSKKNKDLVDTNNGLKTELTQEQAIREQLEEQNQSLLADLNKFKAELEQAKNSNIELKESNADLKNANADLKADLQNIKAEEKAKYEAIIKSEVAKAVAEESKRNATMWADKEGKYKKQIKSQQKTIDKQKEHLTAFDTLLNTVNGFFDDLTNSVSNLFKKVDSKDKLTEPEKKEIKATVDNVNKQANITKELIKARMAEHTADTKDLTKEESKQNKPK